MDQPRATINRNKAGIYATHNGKQLLFSKAMIDGVPCAAYVKNNEVKAYIPLSELVNQLFQADYLEIKTT